MLCARGKSRTYDRPSISRVLYQLSYACMGTRPFYQKSPATSSASSRLHIRLLYLWHDGATAEKTIRDCLSVHLSCGLPAAFSFCMRTFFGGAARAKPREPKLLFERRSSTLEDKLRRHKNKKRIWRRCVAQLALMALNHEARTLEPSS